MSGRHVSVIFQRELLDQRRERRVFASLFLLPLVYLAMFAVPAFIFSQMDDRSRGETLKVAVQGDVDAVPGLRAALERDPLELQEVEDAARTLAGERAEMGIEVPADAASLVSNGEPVPLRVLSFSTQDVSTRAIPALTRRLTELRRAESARLLVAAGAPEALAAPVRLEIVDVGASSSEGVRFGIAQGIPSLVVIQLFGVLTLAATRLSGAKDRRTLEALLVLPCGRRDLLAGIGAATLLVSTVAALIVLIPLALLLMTLVASISKTLSAPLDVVVSMVSGIAAIAVLLVALGLYVGARSGSGNEGAVTSTLLQLALMGTLLFTPFLAEVAAEGPVLAAPVVGAMLFMRDGVADGPTLSNGLLTVGSQAAIALVVLRKAAAYLETERGVLRGTK